MNFVNTALRMRRAETINLEVTQDPVAGTGFSSSGQSWSPRWHYGGLVQQQPVGNAKSERGRNHLSEHSLSNVQRAVVHTHEHACQSACHANTVLGVSVSSMNADKATKGT